MVLWLGKSMGVKLSEESDVSGGVLRGEGLGGGVKVLLNLLNLGVKVLEGRGES